MQKIIAVIVLILLIGGGVYFFTQGQSTSSSLNPASQNNPNTNQETTSQLADVESGFQDYSPEAFQQASGKRKVLFFHAQWCPDCRAAERDILSKLDQIPEDVVIFKTDYDTERELKTDYGVTYQHTFVYVNDDYSEISKWNGGQLADILRRI